MPKVTSNAKMLLEDKIPKVALMIICQEEASVSLGLGELDNSAS